ncbi:unannotated protein [freshwater metagenome]|uniref:Unannotated protein n=1 Tax=freshwater metagenome TaxID=449393 RepID=A0A6J6LG42_9ZZZZ
MSQNLPASAPLAATCSIGAGFVHAIAAGTHAEHASAALAMALLAFLQIGAGLLGLTRNSSVFRLAIPIVNVAAICGWIATRTTGIGFISGLDIAESVQTADAITAGLAAIAVAASISGIQRKFAMVTPMYAALIAMVLVVPATVTTTSHDHSSHSATSTWPRPFFPGIGIDIEGVEGVSTEQENRARQLVLETQKELVRWADYKVAQAEGWISIGDEATGYEHFVNGRYLNDGNQLDATRPESIVYKVYGDTRILVSAMYMAEGQPALDSPLLTDFAGPLFEWHVHTNLCWGMRNGGVGIVGVTDANGKCPPGSMVRSISKPMVHVWIVPHPCGPFAAVEGLAEGQAAVPDSERVDMCGDHAH